ESLMQRYRRGDEAAFRALYERHRAPLLRFVRRVCPHVSDAEEVVQETWIAVIKGRDRYRPQARFVTWLFSIARRRVMDGWRKKGRLAEFLEPIDAEANNVAGPVSDEPESMTGAAALYADLNLAVAALPPLQREAFLLRAEGGLRVDEIAEITGTNRE